MDQPKTGSRIGMTAPRQFGLVLFCLLVVLGYLFWDGIKPNHVLFSNDGPLGLISSASSKLPEGFTGNWQIQNWVGLALPSSTPDVSAVLATVCGPVLFAKIYAPFALLFLGLSAWLCFRQWKFSPMACIVGGIAAALNSDFFSTACWGVAGQPLSFGCDFLALAALADESSPKRWVRVVLAGFAVGVGVMEAFDIGAIFSLVVAAYVVYQGLISTGSAGEKVGRAVTRLAVVGGFAGFIAAAAVSTLVSTQIQGVAGMGQDAESKAKRWREATMWSMPKAETLSLIVPGLFGFRMDTPNGGNYWGACGRDPVWDLYFAGEPLRAGQTLAFKFPGSPNPFTQQINDAGKVPLPGIGEVTAAGKSLAEVEQEIIKLAPALSGRGITVALQPPGGMLRYGGGGIYIGVVVVLIALWGAFQGFRKEKSVFSLVERKFIWFWVGMAVLCALIGFGRFAPFYQFFYALPFASTMRNPSKFYHVVEWITVILFAYGVHGLGKYSVEAPLAAASNLPGQLRTWWAKGAAYDRRWVVGLGIAVGVSLLGWLIYASSSHRLIAYLKEMSALEGRSPEDGAAMAAAMAAFTIKQVGWYVLFLALGALLLSVFLSGYFGGRRWKFGVLLLGLLVVADLGIANRPWVIGWNWVDKYASNPVVDLLRKKPYEQRVAVLPFRAPPEYAAFTQLYDVEWKQQLFPYYNIQTLDIVMMPRAPVDYIGFESAMAGDGSTNTVFRIARRWQLTNTRYLLGAAGFLDVLNSQIDPEHKSFKYLVRFDLALKPGVTQLSTVEDITVDVTPQGQYAIFDYTAALPRAKLYTNWQVSTNDEQTLMQMASKSFDPEKSVFVANPLPPPTPVTGTNQNPGTVEFVSYAPKLIVLKANATQPSVLLLNDKTDPSWHVTVDGKPETLLRCNYLMRGVFLQPGAHTVEFRFQPAIGMLYVSIGAVVIAILLLGYLFVTRQPQPELAPDSDEEAKPVRKPKR